MSVRISCSNQPVYQFFADNDFVTTLNNDGHIEQVDGSQNSFRFCADVEKCDQRERPWRVLCQLFGFSPEDKIFRDKYDEAISGDGHEYRRITTLKSSSLAALLCFSKVSADTPLRLSLNGLSCVFTNVEFEVSNPIPHSTHASNMDVVLTGHLESNEYQEVKLFLECKFSEYLTPGNYYGNKTEGTRYASGLSKDVYAQIYKDISSRMPDEGPISELVFAKIGEREISYFEENFFITGGFYEGKQRSLYKSSAHYCGGFKQMVSHFLGVRSYKRSHPDEMVYLGEMVFDFRETQVDNAKALFDDYHDLYGQLAKVLRRLESPVVMVDNLLTYQDVFEQNQQLLLPSVKAFYNL